jgi:hypothetical protein
MAEELFQAETCRSRGQPVNQPTPVWPSEGLMGCDDPVKFMRMLQAIPTHSHWQTIMAYEASMNMTVKQAIDCARNEVTRRKRKSKGDDEDTTAHDLRDPREVVIPDFMYEDMVSVDLMVGVSIQCSSSSASHLIFRPCLPC